MSKLTLARFIAVGSSLLAASGCAQLANQPVAAGLGFTNCTTVDRDAVSGPRVRVEICPAQGARNVGGTTNAGAGRIVARMTNLDPVGTEKRWELEPGQTYFVIVSRARPGPGLQFQIVGPGNADNTKRVGEYYRCQPEHGTPSADSAKFGTCGDVGHVRASSGSGSPASKGGPSEKGVPSDETRGMAASPHDGPAWISCPTGCCTTEAQ